MIKRFTVTEEMKRQIFIRKLLKNNITKTKEGISIYDLDCDSLRHEVALMELRNTDIECESNKWFGRGNLS